MRSQAGYLSARHNRFIAMDVAEPAIDYVALAGAMGVPAQRIGRAADIAPAVETAIASRRTSLLEVTISAE
jgi:benzoylformate decarboxylase